MASRIFAVGLLFLAFPGVVQAQVSLSKVKLLKVQGIAALADGASAQNIRVRLRVDLDRDGLFSEAEDQETRTDANGRYKIDYVPDLLAASSGFVSLAKKLIEEFEKEGFQALVKAAPMPIAVSFEREGYASVTRAMNVLALETSVDAVLAPLQPLGCSGTVCATANGEIAITGLTSDVVKAYARAYSPVTEPAQFPGNFSDSKGNLLLSSGFFQVDLRDDDGDPISSLGKPTTVRFKVAPESWASLIDLSPGTDRIELPIYSFDDQNADWKAEANGHLELAGGTLIPERDLSAIQDGGFGSPVYASIQATHFSSWNIDQPVETHSCVKGRLVDPEGNPRSGARVTVKGVTYSGWAMEVSADADGIFAMGVMKSETASEDIDRNGRKGETFRARVALLDGVAGADGPPFDTPTARKKIIENKGLTCLPAQCDCTDLGTITLGPKAAKLCTISGTVRFSGQVQRESKEPKAPVKQGDPVRGVRVGARDDRLSPAERESLCRDKPCGPVDADEQGRFSVAVPAREAIVVEASLKAKRTGSSEVEDYWYGRAVLTAGCAESGVVEAVDLSADYSALTPTEIALKPAIVEEVEGPGCGCEDPSTGTSTAAAANGLLYALPIFGFVWSRRKRP